MTTVDQLDQLDQLDQGPRPPIHRAWLLLLALPAFVSVWGGWVGLGTLAGFGPVALLPGIADGFRVNLAVTLPAGMEAYAVIGLAVWLSKRTASERTRRFAMWSSCAALAVGSLGQIGYHVLSKPPTGAPMFVTVFVSCLPVAILGMGAALFHMIGEDQREHADGRDRTTATDRPDTTGQHATATVDDRPTATDRPAPVPVTSGRTSPAHAVADPEPATLHPAPADRSDDTVTMPVTRDDRATDHTDRAPTDRATSTTDRDRSTGRHSAESTPDRPTATDQHAADHPAAIEHRRQVKQANGTGEAVAYAVSATGTDRPAELARWLTDHGRDTSAEAVRSALRRSRNRAGNDQGRILEFAQRDRA